MSEFHFSIFMSPSMTTLLELMVALARSGLGGTETMLRDSRLAGKVRGDSWAGERPIRFRTPGKSVR
jgi:hypothetical protein